MKIHLIYFNMNDTLLCCRVSFLGTCKVVAGFFIHYLQLLKAFSSFLWSFLQDFQLIRASSSLLRDFESFLNAFHSMKFIVCVKMFLKRCLKVFALNPPPVDVKTL